MSYCSSCPARVNPNKEYRCRFKLCSGLQCASCYFKGGYCGVGNHDTEGSITGNLFGKPPPSKQTDIMKFFKPREAETK